MLYTDLKVNESIKVGGIEFKLIAKNGQVSRIGIVAPKDVRIELNKLSNKKL